MKKFKENDLVIHDDGSVGIIQEEYDDKSWSVCWLIDKEGPDYLFSATTEHDAIVKLKKKNNIHLLIHGLKNLDEKIQ